VVVARGAGHLQAEAPEADLEEGVQGHLVLFLISMSSHSVFRSTLTSRAHTAPPRSPPALLPEPELEREQRSFRRPLLLFLLLLVVLLPAATPRNRARARRDLA